MICEIIGSEKPNEVIVIGGYFDSWDMGDGSHEDGAGCIQSLESLDLFKKLQIKPGCTIRAVFFINEEIDDDDHSAMDSIFRTRSGTSLCPL